MRASLPCCDVHAGDEAPQEQAESGEKRKIEEMNIEEVCSRQPGNGLRALQASAWLLLVPGLVVAPYVVK
jgi:hypothetical protein